MSDSFVTPWNVGWWGPLSMGFSRQEYWSGLPFPYPGDLLDPGIESVLPALTGGFLSSKSPGKPVLLSTTYHNTNLMAQSCFWLACLSQFPRQPVSALRTGLDLNPLGHISTKHRAETALKWVGRRGLNPRVALTATIMGADPVCSAPAASAYARLMSSLTQDFLRPPSQSCMQHGRPEMPENQCPLRQPSNEWQKLAYKDPRSLAPGMDDPEVCALLPLMGPPKSKLQLCRVVTPLVTHFPILVSPFYSPYQCFLASLLHKLLSSNPHLRLAPRGTTANTCSKSCCFWVTPSCPALCDPVDCSTPGLPVHHLPELAQTQCPLKHWCHPTISSTVVPFSSCLHSFPTSGSSPMSQLFTSGGQSTGASASASVLPVDKQGALGGRGKVMPRLKRFHTSKGSGVTPAHFLEACVPVHKTVGPDRKSEKRIIPPPSDGINNSPPALRLVLSETWGDLLSRAWAHPWLLNGAALFLGKYWIHTFKIKLEAKSFEQ